MMPTTSNTMAQILTTACKSSEVMSTCDEEDMVITGTTVSITTFHYMAIRKVGIQNETEKLAPNALLASSKYSMRAVRKAKQKNKRPPKYAQHYFITGSLSCCKRARACKRTDGGSRYIENSELEVKQFLRVVSFIETSMSVTGWSW